MPSAVTAAARIAPRWRGDRRTHRQREFTAGGRTVVRSALVCAVRLEPYERGIVLPHEETMPKHKADRLELMRACRANFSPIFGLYADPDTTVTAVLRNAAGKRPPVAAFTDETGEVHRLWAITDGIAVSSVQRIMADRRIFIADGHHRYETALNYRAEAGAAGGGADDPACNYVMMTLVNLYDPGLVILPTHRLLKNISATDLSSLPYRLRVNFRLEEFPLAPGKENFGSFLNDLAVRGSGPAGPYTHRHVFGIYCGGRLYFATLKNEENLATLMPPDKSPAWQGLDVSVLHCLVIEKYLGVDDELRARGEHITYTREEEGALLAVDRGEYQLAFFLNPTLVEEVTTVAANGEKMPQKSTYFYPKMITGLVINSLE
ncbi:MAG: DUF1015 domain-containing protein [Peptococcaceae bacterium]|nr:DUF1015 domain-containing protein [Peptococcaceae bacterium]